MVVHYSLACGRYLFLANSGDVAVVGRMHLNVIDFSLFLCMINVKIVDP